MGDLLLIIIALYLLFFNLPDLIGEENTRRLEFWWLNKARQWLHHIVEYGKLIVKFIVVIGKSVHVVVLVCTPFILLWLVFDYIYDYIKNIEIFLKDSQIVKQISEDIFLLSLVIFSFALISGLMSLILFCMAAKLAFFISSWGNKLWKDTAKVLKDIWEKREKNFSLILSIGITFCIKLFKFGDKLYDRIKYYEEGKGDGVFDLLFLIGHFLLLLATIGVLFFLEGSKVSMSIIIIILYITLLPAILSIPAFFYGTCGIIITLVMIVKLIIIAIAWIIIAVLWVVFFAPSIFLNNIAQKTGQTMYFKVGKYLIVLILWIWILAF